MIDLPDFPMVALNSRVVAEYRRKKLRSETLIALGTVDVALYVSYGDQTYTTTIYITKQSREQWLPDVHGVVVTARREHR